jgi:hypothetical protein
MICTLATAGGGVTPDPPQDRTEKQRLASAVAENIVEVFIE